MTMWMSFCKKKVFTRLSGDDLPDGVKPDVTTPYGPTGEIFRLYIKE